MHLAVKRQSVLFYNTLDGKALECRNSVPVSALARRLLHPDNLYVVKLTEAEISKQPIKGIIGRLRRSFMADIHEVSQSYGKPLPLKPCYQVMRDVDVLAGDPERSVGEDVLRYLFRINLYLDGSCELDCNYCSRAFRQFVFCTRSLPRISFDMEALERLMNALPVENKVRINLLGGNVLLYPGLAELLEEIRLRSGKPCLCVHYKNLQKNIKQAKTLAKADSAWRIGVDFPLDELIFTELIRVEEILKKEIEFVFVVQSETEFMAAREAVLRFKLEKYRFQPYFNGRNKSFFRKFVFTDRKQVLAETVSQRDIFLRGKVNSFRFGEISVLNDGRVFAGINQTSLGNLLESSLPEMLFREMKSSKSWLQVRSKVTPCRDCLFWALCPPLTDYEQAFSKNNLCWRKNEL